MGGMAGGAGRGVAPIRAPWRGLSSVRGPLARSGQVAACLGVATVAAVFAWRAPAANGLAAAALVGALILDAGGRRALAWAGRRTGIAARFPALPSLALPLGGTLGLGLLAAALVAFPRAFATLASFGAGLLTIGALARLALARTLVAATRETE